MKRIKELIKRTEIKKNIKVERFNKNVVRILYVEPFVNSNDYYRMILPYLELGTLDGFETRVTSVKKWDFTRTNKIGSGSFQEDEIRWADYIVFSMLLENYVYLFRAIKVLNPKVFLVMDIAKIICDVPHLRSDMQILFQNLTYLDIITTPSKTISIAYQGWMARYDEEYTNIEFFQTPSLLSKIGFEGITTIEKPTDDIVRVGMVASIESIAEYKYFTPLFKRIKEKYKDKLELIILGWKPNASEVLKEVDITYHKSVSFLDYYRTIKNLHFDLILIPMRPVTHYVYTNIVQFLEASAIGVPVIALKNSSYSKVIEHEKNGILVEKLPEWESSLIRLIDNDDLRKKLGQNAKKYVWKNHSYTQKNLITFKSVFI